MWRVAAVASSLKSSPKAYRLPHPQHQQHTMERSRQGCGAFATRSVRSASFGATAYTTFDWSTQSTLQLCRPLRRARGRGQSYTAQPTTGPPSPGRSTTSKPTVSRYIDEVDRRISRKPRASARRSATRGLAAVAPWPLRLRPLLWACHRGYFFGASDVHVRLYEPKHTPRVAALSAACAFARPPTMPNTLVGLWYYAG